MLFYNRSTAQYSRGSANTPAAAEVQHRQPSTRELNPSNSTAEEVNQQRKSRSRHRSTSSLQSPSQKQTTERRSASVPHQRQPNSRLEGSRVEEIQQQPNRSSSQQR